MQALANELVSFCTGYFQQRIQQSADGRIQPALVGPPDECLETIYSSLTVSDSMDWRIGGSDSDVAVLLVDQHPRPTEPSARVSARCGWDYAVAVRNSVARSLTLVSPSAWDTRNESVTNATETLGTVSRAAKRNYFTTEPWPYLLNLIARRAGVDAGLVRKLLTATARSTAKLSPTARDRALWVVANRMLESPNQEGLARAAGLPRPDDGQLTAEFVTEGQETLLQLGRLIEKQGIEGAFRTLRKAVPELVRLDRSLTPLAHPLQQLARHLAAEARTGTAFGESPSWYFSPSTDTWWWRNLSSSKLKRILASTTAPAPTKLRLSCVNALNARRSDGEPAVVRGEVHLEASESNGELGTYVHFRRRQPSSADVDLGIHNGDLVDLAIPYHTTPLTYVADGPRYRQAQLNVISLSSFVARGYARIRGVVSVVRRADSDATLSNTIYDVSVERAGRYILEIFLADGTEARVVLANGQEEVTQGSSSTFTTELDDGDSVEVTFLVENQGEVGRATLFVEVEESDTSGPSSNFEALILAHQKARSHTARALVENSPLEIIGAELGRIPDGWRGVIGCWSPSATTLSGIRAGELAVGDIRVTNDLRPSVGTFAPPARYLELRQEVLDRLARDGRPLAELELNSADYPTLFKEYLSGYMQWCTDAPQHAMWSDVLALYPARHDIQGGAYTSSSEPAAILVSPFHPMRLAWQSAAQTILSEGLGHPCPAAGFVDPHAVPASLALPFFRRDFLDTWRAYFSARSNHPYWSLLWSREYLRNSAEKTALREVLTKLGLDAAGLTGSPTTAQALRSLTEVNRILAARATIRVGLAGAGDEGNSAVEGVIEWAAERFGPDPVLERALPATCEVFDLREKSEHPSDAALAKLAEVTDERVLWFKRGSLSSSERLDLTILDQVSALDPLAVKVTEAHTVSAIGTGGFHRVNIRQDFDAQVIKESRVGVAAASDDGLRGLIASAAARMEKTVSDDGEISHLQYQPNQEAISRRLDQTLFLAATSSQVDPACFIRGITREGSYLWDYELPALVGINDERGGYYLIANPPESLKRAIEQTAQLVAENPPRAEELLGEISRRGIPVLKRMAGAGSIARGELGALLAVRYLQDAYRTPNSGVRLPVFTGNCVHFLLSVDSYWEVLKQFQRALIPSSSAQHADLLSFAIRLREDSQVDLRITPIEVKFREAILSDSILPEALAQARNLGLLLAGLWGADQSPNELWRVCGRALLAQCVDQCFRVYADDRLHGATTLDWAMLHQRVIHSIVGDHASIHVVREGRLLVFDGRVTTEIRDMDADGRRDTIVVGRSDAESILTGSGLLSPNALAGISSLGLSFTDCGAEANLHDTPEMMGAMSSADVGQPIAVDRPAPAEQHRLSEPTSLPSVEQPAPLVIGWQGQTDRWSIVGSVSATGAAAALDLDNPKAVGIFGYMGSGKSYLLGTVLEGALLQMGGLNRLAAPLSVVIFNYRRNATDRFELASLLEPNDNPDDIARLAQTYRATPKRVTDMHVLALPGELTAARLQEYQGIPASELFFRPETLGVEDWELLMGEPGSDAVFARTIRHVLIELRGANSVNLEDLESHVLARLSGQSRSAAVLRFDFVRRYISSNRGIDFQELLRPGRAVIIDLRQPLFNKDDALRFFLVCASQTSQVQGRFNKMVIFDEAHEYLSNEFGERLEARIRQMRHEGTSYLFATQDVGSIPLNIRRFITTRFVFDLGTRENVDDLLRFAPEFRTSRMTGLPPGHCLVQSTQSSEDFFRLPTEIRVRPRVTRHGGGSRIFNE